MVKKELIAYRNPKAPIAEMFRTLRTNLQFMNSQKEIRTILVTSTMLGEGKSWTSSNLAITFAQAGKKIVIVDSDMRKGRLSSLFQVENFPGLSNYLSGIDENGVVQTPDILKYVKETEITNLYVITAGNIPPNPSELLASDLTIAMINKLKENYDIIIFDGTPSLLVTDALILARLVDTTILVASYKETKKENLVKVKKLIKNVGGNIAGVLINKVQIKAEEYKTSYYYGSQGGRDITSKNAKTHNYKHKLSEKKQEDIVNQLEDYLKKEE